MTLAQWYMEQAKVAAEIAEDVRGFSRLGWVDKAILKLAQNDCAIHVKLAQEAAARYGGAA